MKKTIGIMGGFALCLFTASAYAQQTEPQQPQPVAQTWDAKKNPTVDSIAAKYKDKIVVTKLAPTTEDIFPALGKFESASNTDAANVTITLDEQNKGVIWITGLPQGKIKAMLRKSPATYKIPAQKNEEGKDVAEGTLIFDKDANTLSISIGKTYNAENPSAVFAAPVIGTMDEATANTAIEVKKKGTKTKSKVKKPAEPKAWTYTGTKVAKETVMN